WWRRRGSPVREDPPPRRLPGSEPRPLRGAWGLHFAGAPCNPPRPRGAPTLAPAGSMWPPDPPKVPLLTAFNPDEGRVLLENAALHGVLRGGPRPLVIRYASGRPSIADGSEGGPNSVNMPMPDDRCRPARAGWASAPLHPTTTCASMKPVCLTGGV